MGDYVSGKGLSNDEIHIALVVSTDPLYFEDAVKSTNWRLAMDSEIKSIEKNKHGHLLNYQLELKKMW